MKRTDEQFLPRTTSDWEERKTGLEVACETSQRQDLEEGCAHGDRIKHPSIRDMKKRDGESLLQSSLPEQWRIKIICKTVFSQ